MSNAPIVYRRLIELGYTPAQAAGVIGNLQQESGSRLDPNVVGDKGTAFGIAQWRGPRYEALQRFASEAKKDWRDPVVQTDFIDYELKNTERRAGDLLRSAKTPEEAARAFVAFERPAGFRWDAPEGAHGFENRVKFATSFNPDGMSNVAAAPASTPAAPVYSTDLNTAARWLGNKALPNLIDAPTPLPPEQATQQKADLASYSDASKGLSGMAAGLLQLAKLAQPEEEEEMRLPYPPQIRQAQFVPLKRMRGLL
jgi:hypothetical protein